MGKPFRKVYSSRFCGASILKMQNSVDDILINMGYKIQFPSAENINALKEEILMQPEHKILIFEYTDYNSHETLTKIDEVLQSFNGGETLVLVGYSLLTHFNVGLLYLISCAFNCLKIKFCNDMGSVIILEHYNHNLKILKRLIDIKIFSCDTTKNGKTIFGILPASFLYGKK